MGEKSLAEAYILGIPFGLLGAHHFYLGRTFFGMQYVCTGGLLGIGYLYDLVRMKWLVIHVNEHGNDSEEKMLSDCYLLGVVGGLFGAHHFYLGNPKLGMVYACTFGVFTIGWIVDLVRMKNLLEDYSNKRVDKSLVTAYILGVSPLGILGAHHYYLEHYPLGVTYTLTGGLFGCGWIGDLFRMKDFVAASNDETSDQRIKLTAYAVLLSPLGIFGAHHFYLDRYLNGVFFTATFGLFFFGWIIDMFRMRNLYERYTHNDKRKYVDDAYLFWFPFGILGLHQFYLDRNWWGLLYACTLGCIGVGWIVDGCRLPSLVADYNDQNTGEFKSSESKSKATDSVIFESISETYRKMKRRKGSTDDKSSDTDSD